MSLRVDQLTDILVAALSLGSDAPDAGHLESMGALLVEQARHVERSPPGDRAREVRLYETIFGLAAALEKKGAPPPAKPEPKAPPQVAPPRKTNTP